MKILLIALFLVSCSASKEEFIAAEKICVKNDGMKIIWKHSFHIKAVCNDGAEFTFSYPHTKSKE